jgi:NAD(P)-dependent dehydrogenase (short-subunit alcohol dehydrogenase family)
VEQFERLRTAWDADVAELVVVTALGGGFALDDTAPTDGRLAVGSAAAAMAKTFARELECRARVIDIDTSASLHHVAEHLAATLRDVDPPFELGIAASGQMTVTTVPAEDVGTGPLRPLGPESVVVITGGGRGIGAATALGLARRYGCGIELIGRSLLPTLDEAPHLAAAPDASALRRALIEHEGLIRPGEIEGEVTRILASREIRSTLTELDRHAAFADYHAVDVADGAALRSTLEQIRERRGRIDGVLHAAGIREDKLIRDKTVASFTRVLRTKVDSAEILAEALDERAFMVLFASVAGYFGNSGQVDYAAANAVLDGMARARRPKGPRTVAIDWGPWAGGGMVTPELAEEYARRGIGLIAREDGVAALLTELERGLPRHQLVVMCASPDRMQPSATPGLADADA